MNATLVAAWLGCAAGAHAAGASAVAEDIRDIRGPKSLGSAWLLPALLVGGALLAMGGYAAWRWYRRVPSLRSLLPHEIALERLAALHAQLPGVDANAFAVAASDIIRGYIETRFGVTATRRTTEEFLTDILQSSDSPLIPHRPLLNEFLRRCDYAKFAGAALALTSMEGMYAGALSFVRETAPQAA